MPPPSAVERYSDSWQYAIKRTPIENLMFEVSVFRSPIMNEMEKALVVRRKFVPWAQKVFSPSELVTLFNSVYSQSGAGSTREEQLQQLLEPFHGENDEAKMKTYLNRLVLSDGTEDIVQALQEQDAQALVAPDGLTPEQQEQFLGEQRELADKRRKLTASYKQAYHIFTRPPSEGYLNPEELASEVIPPQPYTDLARHILRIDTDGRDISKSGRSGGGLLAGNNDTNNGENDDANNPDLFKVYGAGENPDVPFASRDRSFFICLATGQTTQPLEGMQNVAGGLPGKFLWRGKERVMIQLVKLSDGTLMTRPSLLDEHVISVDENFITTFRITLSSTKDGNAALVDIAGKHLTRKSNLVDGIEEDDDDDEGTLTIVEGDGDNENNNDSTTAGGKKKKRGKRGAKRNAEQVNQEEQKRAASRDRKWLLIKSNVVKRGVVLEFAKRAQSPSTLDSRGGVHAAKMLRQALGIHDNNNNNNTNKTNADNTNTPLKGGFKTGADIFGSNHSPRGRHSAIPTLAIGNNNNENNQRGGNKNPSFLSPPQKGILRVNFFVMLESINYVERESVFARCSWVFPPAGVALDTEGDRKGGVRELMQITTQTSFASRVTDIQNNHCTRHVLNVPIELHVLMHENSPGTPRLVIEVFSGGDGGGHQTLEGYALVTCSPVPGLQRNIRVDMWRPIMSGWEMMKSVFIGGSASLVDRETAAVPYGDIALEAQTLTNAVKREIATQQALSTMPPPPQQQQQQMVDANGNVVENTNFNVNNAEQQQYQEQVNQMLMMNVNNPTNLTPEVETDLIAACSVASHSRAGLMTTSEGSVQLSVMCCVQKVPR